jgi:hypothetical protein
LEDGVPLEACDSLATSLRCREKGPQALLLSMHMIARRDLFDGGVVESNTFITNRLDLGLREEDSGKEEPAFVELLPLLFAD